MSLKGKLTAADETPYARSKGLFIRQTKEKFQSMDDVPEKSLMI